MYDIYLGFTLRKLPEVSDLIQEVPLLADPAFQNKVLKRSRSPGALGLELPKDLARRLLERFKTMRPEGYYFPSAYHQPRITLEQATLIAAQEIEKQRLQRDPTDLFHKRRSLEWYPGVEMEEKHFKVELTATVLDALSCTLDYPCYWGFLATSAHMREKGLIPGAWGATVDKLDGHIWSDEQVRCLFGGLFDW